MLSARSKFKRRGSRRPVSYFLLIWQEVREPETAKITRKIDRWRVQKSTNRYLL